MLREKDFEEWLGKTKSSSAYRCFDLDGVSCPATVQFKFLNICCAVLHSPAG
jgi:hypothetical protein